jgi:hypothetical protein
MCTRIQTTGLVLVSMVTLTGLSHAAQDSAGGRVDGAEVVVSKATAEVAALEPDKPARSTTSQGPGFLRGGKAVGVSRLAASRGGTAVASDMQLQGVVGDNRVSDAVTGSNLITQGAFNGAAGVPVVIQNSGNNVLIQNATIINLQLK